MALRGQLATLVDQEMKTWLQERSRADGVAEADVVRMLLGIGLKEFDHQGLEADAEARYRWYVKMNPGGVVKKRTPVLPYGIEPPVPGQPRRPY